MNSRILQVFYDDKCYPFKDQERQVRFPIVGNSFVGASNITSIRFYIDRIGSIDDTWVANSKLPNGKMGNEILTTSGSEVINGVEEHYVELSLSTFYTQARGDVYISLNGFYGGVEITENNGIYEISGVPTIQATGSIKLAVYYATPLMDGDQVDVITLQQILAEISTKLGKSENKYLKVVSNITSINTSAYEDYIGSGDVVYSVNENKFYLVSGTYPSFTYSEVQFQFNNLIVANLNVVGTMYVSDFSNIEDAYGDSLTDFINARVNYGIAIVYTLTSSSKTLSDAEFELLTTNHNIRILYNGRLYDKTSISVSQHTYICGQTETTISSGYTTEKTYAIGLALSTKVLAAGTNNKSFYNKDQADTQLNLKADKSDTYTKAQVDSKLAATLHYEGTKTVAELNALTLGENDTGKFYNISDSGVLTWTSGGTTHTLEVLAGDNVCWTGSGWDKLTMDLSVYDDKFIAAGFFEVEDYDDSTGEITIIYSSDLYDMSYNSNTGILTIEAN